MPVFGKSLNMNFFNSGGFICFRHGFFILIRRSWYQIKHIKSWWGAWQHITSDCKPTRVQRLLERQKGFNHGNRSIKSTLGEKKNRILGVKMKILLDKLFSHCKSRNLFCVWTPIFSAIVEVLEDVKLVEGIPKIPICQFLLRVSRLPGMQSSFS